ncbi:kinesin-like protein KIF28P isoform X2 [Dysidea avara]|uniref:kinesin-like protein KIF28P isoform X2 n=1 Tax=Dysidea avara TaxID=196820 RepID=UPI00331741A6
MAENVRVAVRVRPFNDREKTRDATLIISMSGSTTEIKDPAAPNAEPRKFAFDYSYWSHDGFEEREDGYFAPVTPIYADQQKVFDDLGRGVLDNAWKGYNCSLFAYGQTGSGKSYSMVGYKANKGIVPITCEQLFVGIDAKKSTGQDIECQVTFSMLEIYNEQVRDLLSPHVQKGGLKVRQHQSKGFYVENLMSVAVKDYKDIEGRMNEGTKNRTVASTNMNATSSRAHTIVAIQFVQKTKDERGKGLQKTSIVNLVDLAGSERADATGATGARLQEGSAINKSLSTLGNVIKALAEDSDGKKKVVVPYRDSVLTKLLKNALGGNSKTIMIAALSPADINYEETLSTLRFADRAKTIKTTAIINESETDKLIRHLREENARLMEMIKNGQISFTAPVGMSDEERARMKKEMEEELARSLEQNRQEMANMETSWHQRLQESEQKIKIREKEELKREEACKTIPHFWNLNEDPQLTSMIMHFCPPGKSRVGNKKANPPAQIQLNGLSIQQEHAVVDNQSSTTILLRPCVGARILVNGDPITGQVTLHHNDRVLFGSNHLYVFHHPQEVSHFIESGEQPKPVTYDAAQGEIAEGAGFDMKTEGKSKDDILLQEDLVELMPMVLEANAISEELNKKMFFEIALVSPQARGLKDGRTEVKVKMRSLENDNWWMFSRNQFLDRKYKMQEMYQNHMEGDDVTNVGQGDDPFWAAAGDVLIGTVRVYLQSLCYMIEFEEKLAITDYKGNEVGHLEVEVLPCNPDGTMISDDDDPFVEDPSELVGKSINFLIRIKEAVGLPSKFSKNLHCKYKFYLDKEETVTKSISGTTNPNFSFSKHYSIHPVTQQFIDYLALQPLVIELHGRLAQEKSLTPSGLTTSELMKQKNSRANNSSLIVNPSFKDDDERHRMSCELSAITRKANRLEKKLFLVTVNSDLHKATQLTQLVHQKRLDLKTSAVWLTTFLS